METNKKPQSIGRVILVAVVTAVIVRVVFYFMGAMSPRPNYSHYTPPITPIQETTTSTVDSSVVLHALMKELTKALNMDTSYYYTGWGVDLHDSVANTTASRREFLKAFYKAYAKATVSVTMDAMKCVNSFYRGNRETNYPWSLGTIQYFEALQKDFGFTDSTTRPFYDSTMRVAQKRA